MSPPLVLFVVTVLANHRLAKHPKRFASMPVRAICWTDAAVAQPVLDMETRLLEDQNAEDWWIEVRIYLANGEGAADGLAIAREDGGAER